MDSEQMKKIAEIIGGRIKQLHGKTLDRDIDGDGDEGDEAQAMFMLNMAYEYNDRNHAELELLYNAIQKMQDHQYGLCEDCEEEIDVKRLMAHPGAKLCIKCAEMLEKAQREYRR